MPFWTVIMDEEKGIVVIHRDIPGVHIDTLDCWCEPTIINEDDERSTEEILKENEIKWS